MGEWLKQKPDEEISYADGNVLKLHFGNGCQLHKFTKNIAEVYTYNG